MHANTHSGAPLAHLPRGLLSRVSANGDPAHMLRELHGAFNAFKANHRGEMDTIQSVVDDVYSKLAALGVTGGHSAAVDDDPAYSRDFGSYFRHGGAESELRTANATGTRAKIQAAMSVGDQAQGGYLAPVEWDRTISRKLYTISPMRRLASVVTTTTSGFSKVWAGTGWGSGWVGETAARPQTTTPQLASVTFKAGEIYAQPALTNILLDDAQFDIQGWLAGEVADTFALQEGITFLTGDGVNKPQGLMTYVDPATPIHPGGNLAVVPSGMASAINPDGLIDFVYSLPASYRNGASWLMNSTTAAAVRKFKDTGGQYLWQPSLDSKAYPTLLGFPVEIDENMPSIAANALPIAFGDFKRGYLINDRFGVRVLRDPFTVKGYTLFYTTKRVGGGVQDPNAIRLLKISAS